MNSLPTRSIIRCIAKVYNHYINKTTPKHHHLPRQCTPVCTAQIDQIPALSVQKQLYQHHHLLTFLMSHHHPHCSLHRCQFQKTEKRITTTCNKLQHSLLVATRERERQTYKSIKSPIENNNKKSPISNCVSTEFTTHH